MRKYLLFKTLLCSSLILISGVHANDNNESATNINGGVFHIPGGSQVVQYKMDISDDGECYVGDNDLDNGSVGICVFQEYGGSRTNIGLNAQNAKLQVYRDGEILNNNKFTIHSNGTVLTTGLFVNQNRDFQVLGKLYCGVTPTSVENDGPNAGKWQYHKVPNNNTPVEQTTDYITLDYWTYVNPNALSQSQPDRLRVQHFSSCGGILNGFRNSRFFEYKANQGELEQTAYSNYNDSNGEYKIEDGVITFIPGATLNGVKIYDKASVIKTIPADDNTTDSGIDNKITLDAQIAYGTIDLSRYISLNNEDNIVLEIFQSHNLSYTSTVANGKQLVGHLMYSKINLFTDDELKAKKLTINNTTGIFNNLSFTKCNAVIPDDISDVYKAVRVDVGEGEIKLPNLENENIYEKKRPLNEYIYKLKSYSENFNNYNEVSKLFNSNISKLIYNGIVDNSGNVVRIYGRKSGDSDEIESKVLHSQYGLLLKNKGADNKPTFSQLFNTYKYYNGYVEVPSDNSDVIYELTEAEKENGVDYLNLALELPNTTATSGYHAIDIYLQLIKNKNIKISNQYINKSNNKSNLYAAPLRLYLKNPWEYSYNSGSSTGKYSGKIYRDLPVISIDNIKTNIPGSSPSEKVQNLAPEYLSKVIEKYIVPKISGYGASPLDTPNAKVRTIATKLLDNESADSDAILTKLCDILAINSANVKGVTADDKIETIADDYLAEIQIYYADKIGGSDAVLDYLVNLKFIDLMKDTVDGADTDSKIATLSTDYLSKLESNYTASEIASYTGTNSEKILKIAKKLLDNTAATNEQVLKYLVLAINNIDMTNTSSKISSIANNFLSMMETKVDTSKIDGYSGKNNAEKIKAIVKALDNTSDDDEKILDYLISEVVNTIDGDDDGEKIDTIADEYLSYMENYFAKNTIEGYSALGNNSNKVIALVKQLKNNTSMTNDEILEYLLQLKADEKEPLNIQICQDYDGTAFYQYSTTFQNDASNGTLKSLLTDSELLNYAVGCSCENFEANSGDVSKALVSDTFSIGYGDHSSSPIIIRNNNSSNTNILTQNLVINKGCTFYVNGTINVKKLKYNDFTSKRNLDA